MEWSWCDKEGYSGSLPRGLSDFSARSWTVGRAEQEQPKFDRLLGFGPRCHADDHVDSEDLNVIRNLRQSRNMHSRGIDILQTTGIRMEKVVMRVSIRVEETLRRIHDHFAQKSCIGKQLQRIVDRSLGYMRPTFFESSQHLLRTDMLMLGEEHCPDFDSLLGRGNA